jgi:hypothetical protein
MTEMAGNRFVLPETGVTKTEIVRVVQASRGDSIRTARSGPQVIEFQRVFGGFGADLVYQKMTRLPPLRTGRRPGVAFGR